MAKTAKKSRCGENEAYARAKYIKGSERKLNLLAQLIRGKNVSRALIDLEFSSKRRSRDVRKVLEAAIANAENNHGLDVDRLFVKEATCGRALTLRRFRARGRGRSASVEKPFANIIIILAERAEEEVKSKKEDAKKAEAKKETPNKAEAKKVESKKETKPKPKAKSKAKTDKKVGE